MDNLRQIILQEENEARYSRKAVDKKIRAELDSQPDIQRKIALGYSLVTEYMEKTYYDSKNIRIAQLKGLDIVKVVTDIYVGIAYCLVPTLFTSITAQLASRLGFSDKVDAIKTVAELVSVLSETDAFDITKQDAMSSMMVISRMQLSDELLNYVEGSAYLPPMVCEPKELVNNYSNGYLGFNNSLILGKGNHHEEDICLDVLNKVNKVALKLDIEFLKELEEDPSTEFTAEWAKKKAMEKGILISEAQAMINADKAIQQWHRFKKQSISFYLLMASQGNEFYLTNKVDKRGRLYSSGYHINIQGTSYKKASIELAKEELVTGVF